MKITQQDIARDLGLTVGTVSKALRNRSDVGSGTRARVIEAAQRLGYHLPLATQSGTHHHGLADAGEPALRVGVLTLSSPVVRWDRGGFVYEILEGLSQMAELHGVFLSLHFATAAQVARFDQPGGLPPALQSRNVDGLITVLSLPDGLLAHLARDFPCVTVNHEQADGLIDCVAVNLARDFELAIRHLARLGHRRVGFVSSARYLYARRAVGTFVGALLANDLEVDLRCLVDVVETESLTTENRLRQVIDLSRQGVTAWLCRTPYLGRQVLEALREDGLAVPSQVSVIAHSLGMAESEELPSPTGIEMPLRELGRQALLQLLERRANPKRPPRTVLLPGRLVQGNTTAPPPHRPPT